MTQLVTQTRRHNPPKGRPWTSKEVAQLRQLASLGAEAAAELLDRSVHSVRQAAKRHRISLRRPGSRAGLILGQPRGISLADARQAATEARALAELRTRLLTGDLDPTHLEQALRRAQALAAGAALCPACATNPQEVTATGFCRDCHLKALAQAHRDAQAHAQAQRELWRERQAKVRRRRRTGDPHGQDQQR